MNKLLGNEVEVVIKEESITGLLFDIDDEFVYLQSGPKVYSIPKDSVRYYISNGINAPEEETQKSVERQITLLQVVVDGDLVSEIDTSAMGVDLNDYQSANKFMTIAASDMDVQEALRGRIQVQAEYSPGCLVIETRPDDEYNPSEKVSVVDKVSFSMGGGKNPMADYVNPSEMVKRVDSLVRKKNEK